MDQADLELRATIMKVENTGILQLPLKYMNILLYCIAINFIA